MISPHPAQIRTPVCFNIGPDARSQAVESVANTAVAAAIERAASRLRSNGLMSRRGSRANVIVARRQTAVMTAISKTTNPRRMELWRNGGLWLAAVRATGALVLSLCRVESSAAFFAGRTGSRVADEVPENADGGSRHESKVRFANTDRREECCDDEPTKNHSQNQVDQMESVR